MNYTPEITFGNILTIVAFVVAVIGAFYGLKGKMDVFVVMMQHNNDRIVRMENRPEQRLTKIEENDLRLTSIVQEIIGQNSIRERWDDNRRNQERTSRRNNT